MVDPGVVTGVYYITFCNIAPHVTWQQLKRYIAQVCEVDRVEIFPASTSGWVRVKGHHNFEKAWALLKDGYQNRDLRPSAKNCYDALPIKERFPEGHDMGHGQPVIAGPSPQVEEDHRFSSCDCNYRSPKTQASQPRTYTHSQTSLPPKPVRTNNSDQIWPAPSTAPNSGRSGYLLPMKTEIPASSGALTGGGQSYPQRPRASHARECSDDSARRPALSTSSMPAKLTTPLDSGNRKILVKGFGSHADESEIRFWIFDTCGPLAMNIRRLDVPARQSGPRNSSSKKQICGFAFVVYRSASVAAKAVDILHNREYKGTAVTARLINDSERNSPMSTAPSGALKR
ncbi:unnamed protein product [Clonostachys rosea f. rosea IK726]|uniref:Uncharacterized protein n=1 Tax=Clonostachys rosea f. rosea IK726 TaxID=1349383 RepID=A0ACA9TAC2_BIOOC|nr:unnamed protein product [Clonostachys rosea f. rosea IK726]